MKTNEVGHKVLEPGHDRNSYRNFDFAFDCQELSYLSETFLAIYQCEMGAECYPIRNACKSQLLVGQRTPFVQICSNRRSQLENTEMPMKTDFIMTMLLKEL